MVVSKNVLSPTAAQGAYANAINLRVSDVRGLPGSQRVIPKRYVHGHGRLGLGVATHCEAGTFIATSGSPKFRDTIYAGSGDILPSYDVQSFVYFTSSPQAALAVLNAAASARTRSCLGKVKVHHEPFTSDRGRFSTPPSPVAGISTGGQHVIGITVSLDPLGGDLTEYTSTERWFGFAAGSAIVVLEDSGAPQSIPQDSGAPSPLAALQPRQGAQARVTGPDLATHGASSHQASGTRRRLWWKASSRCSVRPSPLEGPIPLRWSVS